MDAHLDIGNHTYNQHYRYHQSTLTDDLTHFFHYIGHKPMLEIQNTSKIGESLDIDYLIIESNDDLTLFKKKTDS